MATSISNSTREESGVGAALRRQYTPEDLVSFDSASIDQCHAIGVSHYFGIQARLVHAMDEKKRKNAGKQ